MKFENVVFDTKDSVARIVINRPEVMNALNSKTMDELESIVETIEKDRSIRAAIITGAGEKAFVAGADIQELEILDGPNGKAFAQRGQIIFKRFEDLDRPVIAAINGFALGGGCELALSCHIRYASENAKFGQPEVNLGIIPGYGGTQRLPRVVGVSTAIQLILSGEIIDAPNALRIGLVSKVTPREHLIPTVEDLIQTILSRGPVAVRHALAAIKYGMEMTMGAGLDLEANLFGEVCATDDKREGTSAFLEKRSPEFKNR